MIDIERYRAEALEHHQAALPLWVIKHYVDQGPEQDEDAWHTTCACGLEEREVVEIEDPNADWSAWEDPDNHGERCVWAVAARVLRDQLRY